MSYGTPLEKAIPVLCSRASWEMLGWKPGNGHAYTPDLSISGITTQLACEGQPVKFLLISPRLDSGWTDETRFVASFVARYGLVQRLE